MADTKPTPPIRTLVINLMFSMFISLVVFSVASYYFLVPHMSEQDMALQTVNRKVDQLTAELNAERTGGEAAGPGEEAAAPAPAAAAAPADAPAAAAAAEPAK